MNFIRLLPIIVVLPTFVFVGYWMWRYVKASGTGKLPRTPQEAQKVDERFKDDFAAAGRKLRWFNFWLIIGIVAVFVISAFLTRK